MREEAHELHTAAFRRDRGVSCPDRNMYDIADLDRVEDAFDPNFTMARRYHYDFFGVGMSVRCPVFGAF